MRVLTYNDYMETANALSFEDACDIHEQMADEIGEDPVANELYDELMEKAADYSIIRTEWEFIGYKQQAASDMGRTMKHELLIEKFDQLAKYLRMQGHDVAWRYELGYEGDDAMNRKRIGDMGCYLAFIHGLNAR